MFEKSSNIKFIKIRSLEAEFLLADEQTDMTKIIVAFHNFAKAPKINERKRKYRTA
jgi:hypothetical protein